jgi:hypothetical protein
VKQLHQETHGRRRRVCIGEEQDPGIPSINVLANSCPMNGEKLIAMETLSHYNDDFLASG